MSKIPDISHLLHPDYPLTNCKCDNIDCERFSVICVIFRLRDSHMIEFQNLCKTHLEYFHYNLIRGWYSVCVESSYSIISPPSSEEILAVKVLFS